MDIHQFGQLDFLWDHLSTTKLNKQQKTFLRNEGNSVASHKKLELDSTLNFTEKLEFGSLANISDSFQAAFGDQFNQQDSISTNFIGSDPISVYRYYGIENQTVHVPDENVRNAIGSFPKYNPSTGSLIKPHNNAFYLGKQNDLAHLMFETNSKLFGKEGADLLQVSYGDSVSVDSGIGDDEIRFINTQKSTALGNTGQDIIKDIYGNNNILNSGQGDDTINVFATKFSRIKTDVGNDRVAMSYSSDVTLESDPDDITVTSAFGNKNHFNVLADPGKSNRSQVSLNQEEGSNILYGPGDHTLEINKSNDIKIYGHNTRHDDPLSSITTKILNSNNIDFSGQSYNAINNIVLENSTNSKMTMSSQNQTVQNTIIDRHGSFNILEGSTQSNDRIEAYNISGGAIITGGVDYLGNIRDTDTFIVENALDIRFDGDLKIDGADGDDRFTLKNISAGNFIGGTENDLFIVNNIAGVLSGDYEGASNGGTKDTVVLGNYYLDFNGKIDKSKASVKDGIITLASDYMSPFGDKRYLSINSDVEYIKLGDENAPPISYADFVKMIT